MNRFISEVIALCKKDKAFLVMVVSALISALIILPLVGWLWIDMLIHFLRS